MGDGEYSVALDQLYTRLFRNIYEGSIKWQEKRYQGHDYWQVLESYKGVVCTMQNWVSCSTCRSWMMWIKLHGNRLRNKNVHEFRLGTRSKESSGRNSYQMCETILWETHPAKYESLNREEIHHGSTHEAERRRA